ncbi:TonB-dependent receptor [Membranihabitans maritimus]|uniref:TonB-dependent receptor n=1 Tax=Membranihabitans maritimus TaxID=2904244 RepID=UPI001F39C7D7|nr:TonB-dependent receptor plug domain-containing protein [Membranihabitans maritimus]
MIRMYIIFIFSLFFLTRGTIGFSQDADTLLTDVFQELKVVGYDSDRELMQTPGAVSKISKLQLESFNVDNVLTGMNTVPGVRMEERAPGSYRIAIRGSTLRSPFGVRNIKVYWNNIPFTDPTGSTAFNLLDNRNISHIDLIRGPAGSIYGAGTGGVLQMKSWGESDSTNAISGEIMGGSYGTLKYGVDYRKSTKTGVALARFSHQRSDGYRDHSNFDRKTMELNGRFAESNKRKLEFNMLYSDLNYEIPGGLNAAQVSENRIQARPGNPFALGSEESEAGIKQEYVLFGVTQKYNWSAALTNLTTLYADHTNFVNPFNLDYKRDIRTSLGGRTRFNYSKKVWGNEMRFTLGGEFQSGANVARNFENDYGNPGALNFDDEIRSHQFFVFGRAEIDFEDRYFLSIGMSQNSLRYDINRLVDNNLDSSFQVIKSFDPVWVPRIGISKRFDYFSLHGSVSYGFSPPTIEDVRTNEGSINLDLDPERGTNFELGARAHLFGNRWYLDGSVFYFILDETIVQQQSDRGTVLFENTGATRQLGVEFHSSYDVIKNGDHLVRNLKLEVSYTHHDFSFRDYKKYTDDGLQNYSGNDLTGVAPNILVLNSRIELNNGIYVRASVNHTDPIPLDDANTVYSRGYQNLLARAGVLIPVKSHKTLEVYAGGNNLLNQKFSLGNDLNAFGGRFYQPAPEINFYGGIKISI